MSTTKKYPLWVSNASRDRYLEGVFEEVVCPTRATRPLSSSLRSSARPLRRLPPTLRLPPACLPAYRRDGELPLASTAKRVWFVAPGWWVVKLVFPRCAPAVTSRLALGPPGFAPLTCGYDQSVAGGGQRYLARLLDQPSDSRAHFCVRDSTNLAPRTGSGRAIAPGACEGCPRTTRPPRNGNRSPPAASPDTSAACSECVARAGNLIQD